MELKDFNSLFSSVKCPELFGRYITNSHIENCMRHIPNSIYSVIGYSVENRPIYSFKFGTGPKKILLWSQMHGNESTTTKALFDCFKLFLTKTAISQTILEACTLCVIPILNPDGAARYTRLNANDIDLNRDAQDVSQPESKILRHIFNTFKPQYCFNLHGQRTLYNVGHTAVSSTLSFLSPSQDAERSITSNRKSAMHIISEIYELLMPALPNGIARYDDDFNINCIGDTFQSFGVPTILYEAGHYPNDYDREVVRRFIFIAILKGLHTIAHIDSKPHYESYFRIPENKKQFYDIIIRNARVKKNSSEVMDIAIRFEERLINEKVEFIPIIEMIAKLNNFYGHREIDAHGTLVLTTENSEIKAGIENDFVLINYEKIALKLKKNSF